MSKETIIVVRGRLDWAKLTGEARPYTGNPKYDKGPYWSTDITPDAASREKIAGAGIAGKLREPKGEKDNRKETFLTLKHLLKKKDGANNKPPVLTNIKGEAWGDALLGNGTMADILIKVVDYGAGSDKGAYMQKVRILEHVPYGGVDFEPISEEDEFFATPGKAAKENTKGEASNPDDLDDDIPF